MDHREYLIWLGSKLQAMVQIPVDNNQRFNASKKIIDKSFAIFDNMPIEQLEKLREAFSDSFDTKIIGNYPIPYDIRDSYDWIEGVLATIYGRLGL